MSLTPKISVIVPVYNAETTLRHCIESILAQTYSNFELLLIDDGSKDLSSAICDEYAGIDSRVRVFHKTNGGVSSARNVGLDNAYGEWITFADSDDYVLTKWLTNFMTYANEKFDLICQGIITDKPIHSSIKETVLGLNKTCSASEAIDTLRDNFICGYLMIKAFKAEIINKKSIRFDEQIHFMEDELFIYQYLENSHIVKMISAAGYCYQVPLWNKYAGIDKEMLYDRILQALHNLKESITYKRFLGYSTDYLIQKLFLNGDSTETINKIKYILRTYESDHPMKSGLKKFLIRNPVNTVSICLLKIYSKARKSIAKLKTWFL